MTNAQRAGRLAPRALDAFRSHFFQAGKIINARAANDAEHRFGHEKEFSTRSRRHAAYATAFVPAKQKIADQDSRPRRCMKSIMRSARFAALSLSASKVNSGLTGGS